MIWGLCSYTDYARISLDWFYSVPCTRSNRIHISPFWKGNCLFSLTSFHSLGSATINLETIHLYKATFCEFHIVYQPSCPFQYGDFCDYSQRWCSPLICRYCNIASMSVDSRHNHVERCHVFKLHFQSYCSYLLTRILTFRTIWKPMLMLRIIVFWSCIEIAGQVWLMETSCIP